MDRFSTTPLRIVSTVLALMLALAACGGGETMIVTAPVPDDSTPAGTQDATATRTEPEPTSEPAEESEPEITADPSTAPVVAAPEKIAQVPSVLQSDWTVAHPLPLEPGEWLEAPELGIELYLHDAEAHTGRWFGQQFDDDPDSLPATVLWGKTTLIDPFSDGDFALGAVYNPHETDYEVIDSSNEISFETVIGGRTAQVTPWVVSQFAEENVGYHIFWDADPDYFVGARSRTLTLEQMGEVLQTVSFENDSATIAGERFGLEPIPIDWEPYYFAGDDYFGLKSGFYVEFDIDELDEDGEDGEVEYWLMNGDIDDITVHRFLAASEEIVSVRGTTGYLLEGLNLWSDYPHTALIWQETPEVIGLMNVDEPLFGALLVEFADRTDIDLLR